jgi:hypothetical protein
MTLKQLARHRATVEAAPVYRPVGRGQQRAGLVPPAVLTVLLAAAVLFALLIVVLGVAGR